MTPLSQLVNDKSKKRPKYALADLIAKVHRREDVSELDEAQDMKQNVVRQSRKRK